MTDPHPEDVHRGDVTMAHLVEDHPDPGGHVDYQPLHPPDREKEGDDGG